MRDREYDDFRETLAPPIAGRTYRSEVVLTDARPNIFEQIIRLVAGVLGTLLAVRFVINLFSGYSPAGFTNFIYRTTNWMVQPFQINGYQPPTTTGGFFDWPALIALVVLAVLASVLIRLIRPGRI